MNISLENLDKVSAVLTIKVEKADYAEKVEAALKKLRKTANLPGFRPGQVPMGLLRKRMGKDVTADEVNKLLGEKLYGYIKENNLNILGEPLPSEDRQQDIDFDTMDEFSFAFDIALAPEFKAELTADDKVDYYDILVDDKMIDGQVKMYTQELDENGNTKEGGIQVENAVLLPEYMKNDEQKAIFNGCKVNDVLVFNPNKAYEGHDVEIASLLKIKKEEVPAMTSDFSFQVQEITRFKEADLTPELFDQVFEKGTVKTEEEFRGKIREILSEQFKADSDYKFILDVRTYLTDKVGKLEYPDAFLKRFMKVTNKDKDEKWVEDNYAQSIQELTWHLIKEQLVKAYNIKVEKEDMLETAKNITKIQFAQYGMINIPDEVLNNYANEMLQKKDQVDSLLNRSVENKLSAALKDVVTLNHKEISVEEFNKLFS